MSGTLEVTSLYDTDRGDKIKTIILSVDRSSPGLPPYLLFHPLPSGPLVRGTAASFRHQTRLGRVTLALTERLRAVLKGAGYFQPTTTKTSSQVFIALHQYHYYGLW